MGPVNKNKEDSKGNGTLGNNIAGSKKNKEIKGSFTPVINLTN